MSLRGRQQIELQENVNVNQKQYAGPWPHIRGNVRYTGQSIYVAQLPSYNLFTYKTVCKFLFFLSI